VTSRDGATLTKLAIGAGGALAPASGATAVATEAAPAAIAVDRTSRLAFVANAGGNSISSYRVDGGDGPQAAAPARVPAQVSPSAVAMVFGDAQAAPFARYAYVANGAGSLSLFTVGASGALAPLATVAAPGTGPQGIAIDPARRFAYAVNSTTNNLSQYAIGDDGRLTALSPATVPGGGSLSVAVTVHPSGRYAYLLNQYNHQVAQFTIAPDGTLTPMTPAAVTLAGGAQAPAMAADPSGRYLYLALSNSRLALLTIGSTGALTVTSEEAATTAVGPGAMTVTPSGQWLLVTTSGDNSAVAFAIGSGGALTAAAAGPFATGMGPAGIAVDPSGKNVYVANAGSSDVAQLAVDGIGRFTPLSPAHLQAGMSGNDSLGPLAIDPTGKYVYVSDGVDPTGVVWQFTRAANGTLTPMTPPTVSTPAFAQFIAIVSDYK
jgi:6-phosphogluconolactonase (cycloisomerase 2 family)